MAGQADPVEVHAIVKTPAEIGIRLVRVVPVFPSPEVFENQLSPFRDAIGLAVEIVGIDGDSDEAQAILDSKTMSKEANTEDEFF